MALFQKLSYPICGISLAFATLGTLMQHYSQHIYRLCGVVSSAILLMIILKILLSPGAFYKDMKAPMIASSLGTFPMTCMLLSVYIKPILGEIAFAIWLTAIITHIALIIYFSIHFIYHLDLKKVYASYYLIYVGIAMIAVTAPAYNINRLGVISLKAGVLGMLMVSALLIMRHIYSPRIPESAKPLSCMLAAPASLILIGYIKSWHVKSVDTIIVLFTLSIILYLCSLANVFRYLKLPFFPSAAAFTFPFVVSAAACRITVQYFESLGYNTALLSHIATYEMIIAVILLLYTFGFYIKGCVLS